MSMKEPMIEKLFPSYVSDETAYEMFCFIENLSKIIRRQYFEKVRRYMETEMNYREELPSLLIDDF